MCWGWVVQLCSRFEEVIWSPWCVGNDPCKFCSVKHGSSEITVQYRIFLCRLMGDNHVEQRRQWFTSAVLWSFCEGLGSILGLRLLAFCHMQKMHRLGGGLRASNVLHGTRPIRVFQGETVIAKSVSYHYISGCPLFNAVRVFQQ